MDAHSKLSVPLLLVSGLALAGCNNGGGGRAEQPAQVRFVTGVDHPHFPLTPGTVRIYEGMNDGRHRREVVTTNKETRDILGVTTTAVVEWVYDDGELTEHTLEWYAQDFDGNVWKFGEQSFEFEGGDVIVEDSWFAGRGEEARAWIAFYANPQVGQRYTGYTPEGEDEFEVLSIDASAEIAAGSFERCLKLIENQDDPDDTDIILYSPGIGRISEQSTGGDLELVEMYGYADPCEVPGDGGDTGSEYPVHAEQPGGCRREG